MKSGKIALIAICFVLLSTSSYFVYQYYKPAKNIVAEKGIPLTAEDLYEKFSSNEQLANQLYLNKVLQVAGEVLDIKRTQQGDDVIILKSANPMFGTSCTLSSAETAQTKLKPGDKIIIKGICTGYLTDVVLIRSVLVNA